MKNEKSQINFRPELKSREIQKDKKRHILAVKQLLAEKYYLIDSPGARRDIERLMHGEPLDYVIGWLPFLGTTIDLSLRPFIPRPETEYWTKQVIEELEKSGRKSLHVLDMFAGSGCIGIAILKYLSSSRVTLADKDPRFLGQIRINMRRNKIPFSRVNLIRSDLFRNVRGKYDVILANPPYVGRAAVFDKNVGRYEPREAYWGGRSGLVAIRAFLKNAKKHLISGGEIWMEHGAWQRVEIKKMLLSFGYGHFSFHRDQYGRPRYVVIKDAQSEEI